MIAEKAFVYVVVLLLTAIAPYWSLLLFVTISPWNVFFSEIIGWDPRIGWAFVLALRATCFQVLQHLPRQAIWGTLVFVAISYLRLQIGTSQISPESLTGAEMDLVYFLAGMCAVYSILKLTNTRNKGIQLISTGACSLLIASAFGLLQAGENYAAGQPAARISGTSGNPNGFAAYLALGATVMLSCCGLKLPGRRLLRIVVSIAVAACIPTFSRMGEVACLLGLALSIQVTRTGRMINSKLIVASIIALTITAGLMRNYLADMRNTLPYSEDSNRIELTKAAQEKEDLSRLEAVLFAFQQWWDQPVWGVGLSTLAERNYIANGLYVTTHDSYAQVLAGTGLAGAALLTIVILSVFRTVPLSMRKYLIPAGAEFAFCSLFADFLQAIEIFVMFAILITILRCLGRADEAASDTEKFPGATPLTTAV